jgi:hypothetical protein
VAFLTCDLTLVCQLQRHKLNICSNKRKSTRVSIDKWIHCCSTTDRIPFLCFSKLYEYSQQALAPVDITSGFYIRNIAYRISRTSYFVSAWSYNCLHGQFIRTFMQILISVIQNSILKNIMKIAKIMPCIWGASLFASFFLYTEILILLQYNIVHTRTELSRHPSGQWRC